MINQPTMGDRSAPVAKESPAGHGFNPRGSQDQDNTQPNLPLKDGNAKYDSLPGIDNGKRENATNIH